jgi:hypothetical protein
MRGSAEATFDSVPHSTRAVVDVAITRVQTSCGLGVPLMEMVGPRVRLTTWGEARTSEELTGQSVARG